MTDRKRIEVFIEKPNLDAQDIEFDKLPAGIVVCWSCRGNGKLRQWYCDAPAMTGRCDWCEATGFRFEDSGRPIPPSVVHQIANLQQLEVRHTMYGNDWARTSTRKDERA